MYDKARLSIFSRDSRFVNGRDVYDRLKLNVFWQGTTIVGHCIPQDWASKRERVFHVTRVEAGNN